MRIDDGQTRAPFQVGDEGGAEFGIARDAGFVGALEQQLHPTLAMLLGERAADVVLPSSASYSTQGTTAPRVPAGTLGGPIVATDVGASGGPSDAGAGDGTTVGAMVGGAMVGVAVAGVATGADAGASTAGTEGDVVH